MLKCSTQQKKKNKKKKQSKYKDEITNFLNHKLCS